jgi:DNA-binding IscR family transcriptional regulator
MQSATRFSVAVHILLLVEVFKDARKVTSRFISSSVNTNPVVIRRIMGFLKKAGLIRTAAGTGGIALTRGPREISLLDIYRSTEGSVGRLLKIHEDTAPGCPVGGNIAELLGPYFDAAQKALEKQLGSYSLEDLLTELARLRKKAGKAKA